MWQLSFNGRKHCSQTFHAIFRRMNALKRARERSNASSSVWCTALQFTHFDVGLRLLFSLRHQEFVRVENEVKNEAKTKTFTKFSLACTVRSCSYTIPWSQYGNRGFVCVYCCVWVCLCVTFCLLLSGILLELRKGGGTSSSKYWCRNDSAARAV